MPIGGAIGKDNPMNGLMKEKSTALAASAIFGLGLMIAAQPALAEATAPDRKGLVHFAEADANGDGALTLAEFQASFAARFSKADTNADSMLDAAEFAAGMPAGRGGERSTWRMQHWKAHMDERRERWAERLFARFDANGDGAIAAEEISARSAKIFALFDNNNDGTLTLAEMPHQGGHRRK
jgi:EF hand